MIIEAEKSLDLLAGTWRPRKAGGVVQSKSKGPRTRGADGVRPDPSLKAWGPVG